MVEDFIKLFTGLSENFGKADMSKVEFDKEKNKIKPKYVWAKEPVTPFHYKQHLDGKISIGIQPCTREGKTSFGCIDIDPSNYKDFNIPILLSLIEKYKLPVIPCRSKSGGLHIYLFLKEEISAQQMRDALATLLLPLELKRTTERYPKQIELIEDEEGCLSGSFINLPYQNEKTTTRYALDKNNKALSLNEFIQAAQVFKLTKADLEALTTRCIDEILKGGDPEFADGPCCLQRLSKSKLTDGRDRFMYNYMVFAKKKYGQDKWPDKVNEANKYFQEPWPLQKINQKIKAWGKETAGHTCDDEIIGPKCIKHECLKRPFGVKAGGASAFPYIYGLEIIMSSIPTLKFMVEKPDGKPVQCEATNPEIVTTQRKLLDLIWLQAGFYGDPLKPPEYRKFLNEIRKTKNITYPAEGTDLKDQLYPHLYDFCINSAQAESRSGIRGGLCWTEEGYHYFLFSSFFETLPTRWKASTKDTGIILKKDYEAEFGHPYNIGTGTIRCVKLKQLHIDQIEYHPTEKKKGNF